MKKKKIIISLVAIYLVVLIIIIMKMVNSYKSIDVNSIQSFTGEIVDIKQKEEYETTIQYGKWRSYSLVSIDADNKIIQIKDYTDDRIKRYIGESINVYTLDHNDYYYDEEAVMTSESKLMIYFSVILYISLFLFVAIVLLK